MKVLSKLPNPHQKKAPQQNMKQHLIKSGSFLHNFLSITLSTNKLSSSSTPKLEDSPTQIVEVKDQEIVQAEGHQHVSATYTKQV